MFISKRAFIIITLTALLTVVSDIGSNLRAYIQVLAFGSMFFIFFQEYGLNVRQYKKVPAVVIYYLVFLFISMFTASLFSDYPGAALFLIARTILFFILSYLIYSQIHNEKDIISLLVLLIVSGMILTLSVVVEFFGSGAQLLNLINNSYTRSSGLISSVNAMGGIIANLIPIILAFLFFSKFNPIKKAFILTLLMILILGVLLTVSRASYISIFVSISVVLIGLKRDALKWYGVGLLTICLVYFVYQPFNEFISLLLRVDDGLSGREVFWDTAVNIIRDNIWLGIGPGSYGLKVYNYLPVILESYWGQNISELMIMVQGANSSHNMYLVYFSDMGIPGLIAAFLIPVVFLSISFKLLKLYKNQSELNYIITIAIVAMGSGIFIRSFFMEMGLLNYGYITTDLPFWICFGIISHLYMKDVAGNNNNPAEPERVPLEKK